MSIYVGTSEIKNIYVGTTPVKEVYVGTTKVRPVIPPYLCFTANTAGSKVRLDGNSAITLETSTDGTTWSTYTISSWKTLSNVGDKIYFRNTSTTDYTLGTSSTSYYNFQMSGSIAASGDVNYLRNKNSTTTSGGQYTFYNLFSGCTSLTSAPTLTSTSLGNYGYCNMFNSCSNLETLPKILATSMNNYSCQKMFYGCSKIKLSSTQTGAYQTAYKIPFEGTGSGNSSSLTNMFQNTGGTFKSSPSINTTYYTSNTLVG